MNKTNLRIFLIRTFPNIPFDVITIIEDYAYVFMTCDKCNGVIKHLEDEKSCAWEIRNGSNMCKKCWFK